MTSLRHVLAAALVAACCLSAQAADTAPEPTKDALSTARQYIKDKQWESAIGELKRVNATGNADWNNLMGYSLRKQKAPDLTAAAFDEESEHLPSCSFVE